MALKRLSPKAWKKWQRLVGEMHQRREERFDFVLRKSGIILRSEKDDPLFPFIIRALWEPVASDMPRTWYKELRTRYKAFKQQYSWLKQVDVKETGDVPEAGVTALAELLLQVRKRQRLYEDAVRVAKNAK